MSIANRNGVIPRSALGHFAESVRAAGCSLLAVCGVTSPVTAPAAGAGEPEVSLLHLYYMARGKDTLSANLADRLDRAARDASH